MARGTTRPSFVLVPKLPGPSDIQIAGNAHILARVFELSSSTARHKRNPH